MKKDLATLTGDFGTYAVHPSDLERAIALSKDKLVSYCVDTFSGSHMGELETKSYWRKQPRITMAFIVADGFLRSERFAEVGS